MPGNHGDCRRVQPAVVCYMYSWHGIATRVLLLDSTANKISPPGQAYPESQEWELQARRSASGNALGKRRFLTLRRDLRVRNRGRQAAESHMHPVI